MDWIQISVRADGEAAEAVSELFNRLNSRPDGQGGAVTEVGGFDPIGEDHHVTVTVSTYLPAGAPDSALLQQQIEEGLWFLGRIHPLGEPVVRSLAEEDWANAWKAHYHPLRIGRRFLVIPAWQADAVKATGQEIPLLLDPGMAFGTGLHPSTQLCLRAMEDVLAPGQRVLDAGCGSGILSIAAARLGAAQVDAFDIDLLAVQATLENSALNRLAVPVRVFAGAGPDGSALWTQTGGTAPEWDVILVNILPHVIIELLGRGLHTYLVAGGRMILAGIILEREEMVCSALAEYNLVVVSRQCEGDWVALVASVAPAGA